MYGNAVWKLYGNCLAIALLLAEVADAQSSRSSCSKTPAAPKLWKPFRRTVPLYSAGASFSASTQLRISISVPRWSPLANDDRLLRRANLSFDKRKVWKNSAYNDTQAVQELALIGLEDFAIKRLKIQRVCLVSFFWKARCQIS